MSAQVDRPVRPETPPSSPSLFRQEVLDENRSSWLGPILIEPTPRSRAMIWAAGLIGLSFVALLLFGTASRKVAMTGWVVPEHGLARVVASQPGVVSTILVQEGSQVTKGTRLLTLSGELHTQTLMGAREEAVRRLIERRDSIVRTRSTQDALFDQQARDMNLRLTALQSERSLLNREIELQQSRLALSRQMVARETEMRSRGLIPLPRLQRTQQEELDQSSRLQSLQRNLSTLERELLGLQNQITEHPLRQLAQSQQADRDLSILEQEIAEAESRRGIVIVAPETGIVTGILADRGASVTAGTPLLTIVPAQSVMQVHLYSPSRGVGFLAPGQKVLLRVQAFPYQRFGFQEGTVTAVSRTASAPSELPPHIAGMSGASASTEPVYRVTVALKSQTVQAYGQSTDLQSGMRVEADVLVDSRRLIEWMFDPLLAITGRWTR